ncbi:MAG: TVP38/TMEM64 family protein [Pseudomonadota bacterium]
MNARRLLLFAIALLLLAGAIRLADGAGQWLFDLLKSHQAQLAIFADTQPLLARAGYVVLFVAMTSLSLPVATALTIAAGAVFGFTEALLLTLLAGGTGATLAMLLARYAFRARVEAGWPDWVARINQGIERDGAFYLLSLRLAPVPPFFVVNAALGLTRMPARTFFLVTLVGIAPFDAMFVNAGHLLGRLGKPEDALQPQLIAAFALIGIVPLLMRAALRRWRRLRVC